GLGQDDTIILTGTADTMSRVFSLVTALENNKIFKNVKVDFTKSRVVKKEEVADFGLTLVLETQF
ncbi:MAG: PilN domain-containing protein, partial [Candidatus Omnitrophota bacterium]